VRLPTVLTAELFPEAELCALRLDGDVFPLGHALVPVDTPVDPAVRAATVAVAAQHHDLVAERWTAAWVHGVLPVAPAPHQLCTDVGRTGRTRMLAGLREVHLRPGDVLTLAGLGVTTPLRTACDLARLEADGPTLGRTLLGLLVLASCSPAQAAAHLAGTPPAPHKLRGCARLAALGNPPPG
jgi:hypothetical protein